MVLVTIAAVAEMGMGEEGIMDAFRVCDSFCGGVAGSFSLEWCKK